MVVYGKSIDSVCPLPSMKMLFSGNQTENIPVHVWSIESKSWTDIAHTRQFDLDLVWKVRKVLWFRKDPIIP